MLAQHLQQGINTALLGVRLATILFTTLLPIAALVVLPTSAVVAQDRAQVATVAVGEDDDGIGKDEIGGDEMRRSASLFILHKMRVALALSDKQVLELLPRFERIEQLRGQSLERRRTIGQQLRTLAKDPSASAKQVDALIAELDLEDERVRQEQNRERDAILQSLEPNQRAGFVLYTQRLRHHMERGMGRGPGVGDDEGPGIGPPGDGPGEERRRNGRRGPSNRD